MTNHTMPVLTEEARQALIADCKLILDYQEPGTCNYMLAEIALASLEAGPIEYLTWHQGCRAPDDCEDYAVVARKGDKSCDGSEAFPVYASPPVPALKLPAKKDADWCNESMDDVSLAEDIGFNKCLAEVKALNGVTE